MTTDVDFYFDYACPWCYLAVSRLWETAARTGATIIWKPASLARVWRTANPQPVKQTAGPNARKVRHYDKDLQDWANYVGLIIQPPTDESPPDSKPAMQGALIAIAGGAILPYSMAVFAARFGDKKDIADPGVLRELANQVGLDATEFDRGLADAGALTTIEANSDELNERGGFGVPTMFVGDSMFFGSDRMPLVEFSLGQASERTFVLPGHHG